MHNDNIILLLVVIFALFAEKFMGDSLLKEVQVTCKSVNNINHFMQCVRDYSWLCLVGSKYLIFSSFLVLPKTETNLV
jgi:hypothetical protein